MSDFHENLSTGRLGEDVISCWLRKRGSHILPAYEVELGGKKGPRFFSSEGGQFRAPDLLAVAKTGITWIECKTKTAFTWFRIGDCWQDGIDKKCWQDYIEVEKLSQFPVWLLFLHRPGEHLAKDTPDGKIPPVGLWGNSLANLRAEIDHVSDRWAGGMVYWNLSSLRKLSGWPLT